MLFTYVQKCGLTLILVPNYPLKNLSVKKSETKTIENNFSTALYFFQLQKADKFFRRFLIK